MMLTARTALLVARQQHLALARRGRTKFGGERDRLVGHAWTVCVASDALLATSWLGAFALGSGCCHGSGAEGLFLAERRNSRSAGRANWTSQLGQFVRPGF